MLKPSDFNNAVPQFQNGNYASNPINPQYVEEPSSTDYNRGSEPLQTLPAQWWNWFMNKFTSRFNKVNIYVKNLFNELAQLLSLVNVTPDGTEGAVTDGQLKNAFKELYPDYINTKLALKATYVKKTQKVNNHALSGDITVTKSDVGLGNVPNVSTNDQTPTYTKASTLTALSSGEKLSIAFGKLAKAVSSLISHIANVSNPHSVTKAQVGLGSVVNTGDSATPVENGTTKFTTGGAYTLKKDLTDIASSLPTDAVLHYSFDEVSFYPDGTADYYRNQDFTLQDGWGGGNNVVTVPNGILTINSVVTAYIFKNIPITNPIVRCKIRTSISDTIILYCNSSGNQYTITSVNTRANEVTEITGFINKSITAVGFTGFDIGSRFEILSFYIGDGSYSTPIIDNANGQWNGTNYGSIPAQGVSGKAIKSFLDTYKPIKNNDFKKTPPYSYSIWLKIPANFTFTQYIIDGRDGTTGTDEGILFLADKSIEVGAGSGVVQTDGSTVPIGEWFHVTVVTTVEGNGNRYKIYKNGKLIKNATTAVANQGFKKLSVNGRYENFSSYSICERELDDFLFFDRALSENEVMALYLNKANTPKYYNINNYILDNPDSTPTQNSTNLVTSGGVYTELAKKANTTYVDTKLAKKVDKTTTVNGHALSGNVTVTKSDVDLGNVVNTGDSAIPVSGGITKFTTGGAYSFFGGNTNSKTWLTKLFSRTIGNSWTDSLDLATSGTQYGVAYGNGVWVIASQRGTFWSENLTNWTAITGVGSASNSIEFKDGIFVLGTSHTGVWWSENGKSYTLATGIGNSITASIRHVGALWFASSGNNAWWSENGKSWTTCVGTANGISLSALDYGDGKYFAAKNNDTNLMTSNDGKSWSAVTSSYFNNRVTAVKYAKGVWFVGTDRDTFDENLFTSKDGGTTWNVENIVSNSSMYVMNIQITGNIAIITYYGPNHFTTTFIVTFGLTEENSCIIQSTKIEGFALNSLVKIYGTYFAFTLPGGLMRSTDLLIWEDTFVKAESSGLNKLLFADNKLLYTSQVGGAQFSEIDLNAI